MPSVTTSIRVSRLMRESPRIRHPTRPPIGVPSSAAIRLAAARAPFGLRVPGVPERLSRQVVEFVQRMRTLDLFKSPGVAETIDWCKCLLALDVIQLSPEVIADTLGAILKYQDDIQKMQGSKVKQLLDEAKAAARG